MTRITRRHALGSLALAALALTTALPASAVTVDEIVKRGSVKIGVLSGVPRYGTVDDKGNPAGYDIDVANLLAGYLGVKVELVPLPPPARIPALQGGKVDFLVATLAATPERMKLVSFTNPYSAFRMVMVGGKGSTFDKLEDMAGKRVGVNRGASQESFITKAAIPNLQIGRYQDDATAIEALVAGQVDGVPISDTVANDAIKQHAGANLAVKFSLFNQANAMAVRLEENELREWLNKSIVKMKSSGDLDKISVKWTGGPVPTFPAP